MEKRKSGKNKKHMSPVRAGNQQLVKDLAKSIKKNPNRINRADSQIKFTPREKLIT